ncbi:MAG: 2-amino-4-hydroxy-6-hydroxymethyldihydropteridine diphosphokinase [Gammaproteobacteria bacterium]
MPRIWVSLGSNIDREAHIRAAVDELARLLGEGLVSPVYETDAEGFEGPAFYNLVTGYESERPPAELIALLRKLEERLGRERSGARFDSRTIDIDLLTYGDMVAEVSGKQLPRDDITNYAFVLKPLCDLAPDELHPVLQKSYRRMWEEFEPKPRMRKVDLAL